MIDKQGTKIQANLPKLGFLIKPYSCVYEDQHSEHGDGDCKIPEKQNQIRSFVILLPNISFGSYLTVGLSNTENHFVADNLFKNINN